LAVILAGGDGGFLPTVGTVISTTVPVVQPSVTVMSVPLVRPSTVATSARLRPPIVSKTRDDVSSGDGDPPRHPRVLL